VFKIKPGNITPNESFDDEPQNEARSKPRANPTSMPVCHDPVKNCNPGMVLDFTTITNFSRIKSIMLNATLHSHLFRLQQEKIVDASFSNGRKQRRFYTCMPAELLAELLVVGLRDPEKRKGRVEKKSSRASSRRRIEMSWSCKDPMNHSSIKSGQKHRVVAQVH